MNVKSILLLNILSTRVELPEGQNQLLTLSGMSGLIAMLPSSVKSMYKTMAFRPMWKL